MNVSPYKSPAACLDENIFLLCKKIKNEMRSLPCTLLLELGQHFVYFEGSKSKFAFVKIGHKFSDRD